MEIKQFEEISDPAELYYRFKDEFFSYIVKHLPEDLEFSGKLIDHYQNYKFDHVRVLIEDDLQDAADILQLNVLNNIVDEVDALRYKTLKNLDTYYSFFYEKYHDLLESNL